MPKISDIWDAKWLNLSATVGSIAILIGFRCGWNHAMLWRIATTLLGAIVACWLLVRAIRIGRQGFELPEEDFIVLVKPGANHNVLRSFLQPLSLLVFLVLSAANWAPSDPEPAWIDYTAIFLLTALALLNRHHYRNRPPQS